MRIDLCSLRALFCSKCYLLQEPGFNGRAHGGRRGLVGSGNDGRERGVRTVSDSWRDRRFECPPALLLSVSFQFRSLSLFLFPSSSYPFDLSLCKSRTHLVVGAGAEEKERGRWEQQGLLSIAIRGQRRKKSKRERRVFFQVELCRVIKK